ncbi:MAG: hypothetical protein RSC44_01185, partial [Clostridia bacterium]
PNSLTVVVKNAAGIDEEVTFTTNGIYNKLQWSVSKFRPSYRGGVIYVTAMLTGADGNRQPYDIPFLVYKKVANNILSLDPFRAIGNETTGSTVAEDGKVAKTYNIDPYNTKSHELSTTYRVTFTTSTPTFVNGKIEYPLPNNPDTTTDYNYTAISMPATHKLTVDANGATAKQPDFVATIQLGSQQRLSVNVQVNTQKLSAPITAFPSGTSFYDAAHKRLTTRMTLGGLTNISIVYFGTAMVYANDGTTVVATYPVTFASDSTYFYPPTMNGRMVVYKLHAAIGALVDIYGSVLETKVATEADVVAGFVTKGQIIPTSQSVVKNLTVEYNKKA